MWLLSQIEQASALEPPHRFREPRRFDDVEIAGLSDAVDLLKALSRPFLNWAGKAERLSFDVPTLPLFVHERLSTKAILETLVAHERDRQMELQLFGDPQLPIHEQLEAYEHKGGWVNRLILGDSLVVMNSLLEYEGLGGQVQMIYIDPPYGVKFGSNFQPFVRRRDVKHNDDRDMTREPEMVKAYRDTWELGLHSYLTYLRDRLVVARDLLTLSGSVFVQISDENVHHVRELMDEVFGEENFCSIISFQKTASLGAQTLSGVADYLLWYARDRRRLKFNKLFRPRGLRDDVGNRYTRIELPDGSRRVMTREERETPEHIPVGSRVYRHDNVTSQRPPGAGDLRSYEFEGITFRPGKGTFKTDKRGLDRLAQEGRLAYPTPNSLVYVRYLDDFAFAEQTNLWTDTQTGAFSDEKSYVVQTNVKVIQRCLQMTTDPGDLVLDPTCGSGSTAYAAEQWGRRWITIDTSRVPIALTRQRLLTATFPYYELQDSTRGPAGGFVYRRRQNAKGDEVGGIVPHVTLKAIANDEPPREEVLVDRPEVQKKVTRVTGPFCIEATIPTPIDIDGDGTVDSGDALEQAAFGEKMLEVLRRSPVLQLAGKSITLKNVREPAKTLSLSAEAALDPDQTTVALVFGPENGAVSEKLVFEAAREAHAKSYEQLIIIGFAIEPTARDLVGKAEQLVGVPATYVQATPDLVMGDLLKTMRSSQIFSVAGLPDVSLHKLPPEEKGGPDRYQVELVGLDIFDPATMEVTHRDGADVPAWFLDTAYTGGSFHVSQAFFPRTGAWASLRKALKSEFQETVWEHLAGAVSAPFVRNGSDEIAVKVIDDRGNELMVVQALAQAR
ncbi:MAG TPA: site-specific DNA-methyltransferase [Gaiellaceae bacterium]|jgi:adenine-specific DNA-methyltransferase|nr:site-specific DNA-methyltransferase [Gaiellaceae bacterium]